MSYMLCRDEEKIALEWMKYQGYTVRPSNSAVLYYKNIISKFDETKNSLLYGGTPEIRSIFQDYMLKLLIIDQSELNVRALGRLTSVRTAMSDNEHFLQSNWLHELKLNQDFDFLIGDDAINMLAWDDFDKFLYNAYRLLKDQGLFICRLLVKPDQFLIEQSFEDVLYQYQDGLIANRFDLASRLNYICYNMKTYVMGWQKTIKLLGEKKLAYFLPDFDFIKTFKFCNSIFCCPPQILFEKLVKKYFTIEEIFYSHEYEYCIYEPIYLLRKNRGACQDEFN